MSTTVTTTDCLAGLAAMAEGSVDLVATDPPYNIGVDYGDGVAADRRGDYGDLVRAWMVGVHRVLRPGGTLWIVVDPTCGATFDNAIVDAGLAIRDRGVWFETFGVYRGHGPKPNFGKDWRPWFYAVKGDGYTFNFATDDTLRVPSARQTKYGDRRADARGRVRSNVWQFPRVCGTFRERVKEAPTQLPLAMVAMVVRGFTNPGDLVLDTFTGTGTTGVAAVTTGRRFVGFEVREQWAEIARRRIADATNTAATPAAATQEEEPWALKND